MKLKWMVLCGIGLATAPAQAEDAIVLDMQTLQSLSQSGNDVQAPNQTSSPATAGVTSAGAAEINDGSEQQGNESNANEGTAAQAAAIRDRVLKSGKMSAREQMAMARIKAGERNIKEGEAFQAENKARAGVVTLPSGVQYKILRAGTGRRPKESDMVQCRYRGTLLDGTEFESTGKKRSMYFYVSTFLPGLKQAVMLMPAGSKWQIVVPPELGYRELGNRLVGPNATLIYEMDLIAIK